MEINDTLDLIINILAVIGGLGFIYDRVQNYRRARESKLIVEFYSKEFKLSRPNTRIADYDVHFDINLEFTNRLGENTTIGEIVLEYGDGKRLPVPETINLTLNETKRKHHRFNIGTNITRLEGTLLVKHTLGEVRLPVNEVYLELEKILSEKSQK